MLSFLNGYLDRSKTIAKPGFNRWFVPPAALAIHLCIGQIYAYSVFNEPMTRLLGVSEPSADDWKLTSLGWIFSIALFVLGASAAIFGKWVERSGPRKTMFVAALCFAGGFFISSIGVELHQLWLIYIGHGLVGGIGLGIGYISPVSTLIKWFPDKPGLATGLAIMGFGKWHLILAGGHTIGRSGKFYDTNDKLGVALSAVKLDNNRTPLNDRFSDGFFIKSSLIFRLPTD